MEGSTHFSCFGKVSFLGKGLGVDLPSLNLFKEVSSHFANGASTQEISDIVLRKYWGKKLSNLLVCGDKILGLKCSSRKYTKTNKKVHITLEKKKKDAHRKFKTSQYTCLHDLHVCTYM